MALSASDFENQHWTKPCETFPHPSRGSIITPNISPSPETAPFLKIDSLEVRSIHGKKYVRLLLKLMPWRFRQLPLGGLKLEVSATEIFRENNSHGDERNLRLKQLVGSNNFATLKKKVEKQKTLHFQQLVAGTKSYFQLLPKIKKYRKIPWQVFPLCRKSVGIPTNAGSRQSSRI